MAGIVRGIAEAEGFTFVLDRNESGLIYAPDSLDITNEVVRKYNAKYAAGGGANPGPAKSDKPTKK